MDKQPTNYFHDRIILPLLSANVLVTLLTLISVLFRLQGGGSGFIIQYRANPGISDFKTGGTVQIIAFAVFAVLVFAAHAFLSWRTYEIHRQLAVVILILGVLLLTTGAVVSDALLALR